jgi:hypothetical protein
MITAMQIRTPRKLALLLVLVSALSAGARQTNNPDQTNPVDPELVAISNVLAQVGELMQTNDWSSTNELAPSNPPPALPTSVRPQVQTRVPGDDRESRRRNFDRQRSERGADPTPAADTANASARIPATGPALSEKGGGRVSYTNFTIIAERNIFNPNRFPIRGPRGTVRPPAARTDSFTLVGTMSYEKGTFAFFDGSSFEYRKALKMSDVIAGYKVANITPDAVNLASGTNQLELKVGMQLRREDQGPWFPAAQTTTYAAVSSSTSSPATSISSSSSSPAPSSGGTESDILKRLQQRREQE